SGTNLKQSKPRPPSNMATCTSPKTSPKTTSGVVVAVAQSKANSSKKNPRPPSNMATCTSPTT
ncbi:unnamed protein product, partial [Aphanomyces euteiches]